MKILKNTLTLLFVLSIITNINAQREVKKLKHKKGCISGDCQDEYGVFVYRNGDKYEGFFIKGLRDVSGTMFYKNNTKYVGDWEKDQRHGNGEFFNENNESIKKGAWSKDVFLGSGCISGDCVNGFGTFVYKYGDKYIGNWKNEKQEGKGTWINTSGYKTECNWIAGFYDGIVKEYDDKGNLLKTEIWENRRKKYVVGCNSGDCDNGNGVYVWENGDRYNGNWANGKRNGKGDFYWHTGQKYYGDWNNDMYEGQGDYVFADGSFYRGTLKNNNFNGDGKYYSAEGILVRIGKWINGEYQTDNLGCLSGNCKNGIGTFLWENGITYFGNWKNGKRNGYGVMKYENGSIYHDGEWKNDEVVKE